MDTKSFAVKAIQFTNESTDACFYFATCDTLAGWDEEGNPTLKVQTPYGEKIAVLNDWIVELADGGFDVHRDEPKEDEIDGVLRSFGYDPVLIGLRGKVFAEVCLENMRLKERIAELEQQLAEYKEKPLSKRAAIMEAGDRRDWDECDRLEGAQSWS